MISNSSELHLNLNYTTKKHLDTLNFSSNDTEKILQDLDPNKASKSICKPFQLIFNQCIDTGSFPSEWKKANIFPIHTKGDKHCLKNYQPVLLLPVCGKVLERLIFNDMFRFLSESNLISSKQSGFKARDSDINQRLCINHEIYKSFDGGFEV